MCECLGLADDGGDLTAELAGFSVGIAGQLLPQSPRFRRKVFFVDTSRREGLLVRYRKFSSLRTESIERYF